jgi:glycosyltransferase involved in cell wall biosynthesis
MVTFREMAEEGGGAGPRGDGGTLLMEGSELPKLSVYLVTRNEGAHLDRVLERVRGADEIVVVDSGSTDNTLEIARRHGARILHREWRGYAEQKAWAMDQCTHDWVLNLDGDEVLPPGGLEAIRRHIDGTDADGLYLAHDDIFMGQTLRWHRHHHYCRVYRRSRASWNTGTRVHEHIDVDGPVDRIPLTLTHLGYDSAHGYMEKLNRYSLLKARQRTERGRGFSNLRLFLVFPVMFLKFYLFRRMFLSGRRGFIKAWIDASQYFLTEAKLYEARYRDRHGSEPSGEEAGNSGTDLSGGEGG